MATKQSFLNVFEAFITQTQASEAVQGKCTTWFIFFKNTF